MKFNLDVNTYKNKFLGKNARQYLFYVDFNFPNFSNIMRAGLMGTVSGINMDINSGVLQGAMGNIDVNGMATGTSNFGYFVKTANLPSSDFEPTVTYWCGQEYKTVGTQKFEDFSITMYVDDNALILKKFWEWQKVCHDPETGAYGDPSMYTTDQHLHLLGSDSGSTICCYNLYGAWPKTINQVTMDYQTNDFAAVDIIFSYQYFTITDTEESGNSLSMFNKQINKQLGRSFIQNNNLSDMLKK